VPNLDSRYKCLSKITAELRRQGNFPELFDGTREIHRHPFWNGPRNLLKSATSQYRRDRTEGQSVSLYLAVEKRGIAAQLDAWFGDLGIPVLPLGGYSSESYERIIQKDAEASKRLPVVLYGGDLDASGEDILRNFTEQMMRRGLKLMVIRIALTAEQVERYQLPEMAGKHTDSRAKGFRAKHGKLVQVELDALDPNILRTLYQQGIDRYWDTSAYQAVIDQERTEQEQLIKLIRKFKG